MRTESKLGHYTTGISYVDQSSNQNSASVTGEADAQAAGVPAETPAQTTPADSSPGDQAAKNTPPTYNIGQPFSVGYWSYVCNRAFWTPWLGSDPYAMERANAEFVVIDMTARNDDTSSSTLPLFHLMDKDGRTYDESSAGALSAGFFSVLEGLNPGVSKRGNVAFDVPPDRQYILVVSGGIESDKRALVPLPVPPPSEPRPSENPQ